MEWAYNLWKSLRHQFKHITNIKFILSVNFKQIPIVFQTLLPQFKLPYLPTILANFSGYHLLHVLMGRSEKDQQTFARLAKPSTPTFPQHLIRTPFGIILSIASLDALSLCLRHSRLYVWAIRRRSGVYHTSLSSSS